jgi:hypothetical protein
MRDNFKFITVSVLLLLFLLLEYAWIPWDRVKIYYSVPFVYDGGPVRLDSWIYNSCVKIEHILVVLMLHLLTPFKKETKMLLIAFGLAFVEFFFTWNEPMAKIWLPEFGSFHPYIPISTATLKLMAVCCFMWGCIKKVWE